MGVEFPSQEPKRSSRRFLSGFSTRSRKSSGAHKRMPSAQLHTPTSAALNDDKSYQFPSIPTDTDQGVSHLPSNLNSQIDSSHSHSRTVSSSFSYPPKIHAEPTRINQSGIGGKFQALRRKIETELGKKRPGSSQPRKDNRSHRRQQHRVPGTVASLRPSPALTVPDNMTVADASQLCAAKRTDCVLVVDDEESLCGIFTAKDLAFRVRLPFKCI